MTQVTPIRDLKEYLSPEQVERLIAVATNPRDVLLIRILRRTGIRVCELIGLTITDIFRRPNLQVREEKSNE